MKRFNGKPCKKCGGTLRYVGGDKSCVKCHAAKARRYDAKNPEKVRASSRQKYVRTRDNKPALMLFKSAKARARKKGLAFEINVADIVVPPACPLLDIAIFPSAKAATAHSPTLDRKNNNLGYVPGNVWVISYRANQIKSDADAEELLRIALRLQALKVQQ